MAQLKQSLDTLTEKWRSTGSKTRLAVTGISNLLARGHMIGLSDGLDLAADDVKKLLEKPDALADGR